MLEWGLGKVVLLVVLIALYFSASLYIRIALLVIFLSKAYEAMMVSLVLFVSYFFWNPVSSYDFLDGFIKMEIQINEF